MVLNTYRSTQPQRSSLLLKLHSSEQYLSNVDCLAYHPYFESHVNQFSLN